MKPYAVALAALLPCLAASVGDVDKAKCLGNAAAPVRIELYSDFECPMCKLFHESVLLWPVTIEAGDAVNDEIVGGAVAGAAPLNAARTLRVSLDADSVPVEA